MVYQERIDLLRQRITDNEQVYSELIEILTRITHGEEIDEIEELKTLVSRFSNGAITSIEEVSKQKLQD